MNSLTTFADQCSHLTKAVAQAAKELTILSTKNIGGVVTICQSCGETEVNQIRVNQIYVTHANDSQTPKQLLINGEIIDLAYTYVNISPKTWVNLAMLSECHGTSEKIEASQFIIEKINQNGEIEFQPSAKY